MKTIILAGGLGTRFSEKTENTPKPMILIDHQPILWHIMDIYASQGHSDFVIATGYKSEVIEDWIENLDTDWKITAIYTGLSTQTGGRIKMCVEKYVDQEFFVTYGDGLGNVNLSNLIHFHHSHRALATVTAVRPPARFGYLELKDGLVTKFGEKNQLNEGWINGGFFLINRVVTDFILNDNESFETGALPRLTEGGKFNAYQHDGFWLPMDTRNEQQAISQLSKQSPPPWKIV